MYSIPSKKKYRSDDAVPWTNTKHNYYGDKRNKTPVQDAHRKTLLLQPCEGTMLRRRQWENGDSAAIAAQEQVVKANT